MGWLLRRLLRWAGSIALSVAAGWIVARIKNRSASRGGRREGDGAGTASRESPGGRAGEETLLGR